MDLVVQGIGQVIPVEIEAEHTCHDMYEMVSGVTGIASNRFELEGIPRDKTRMCELGFSKSDVVRMTPSKEGRSPWEGTVAWSESRDTKITTVVERDGAVWYTTGDKVLMRSGSGEKLGSLPAQTGTTFTAAVLPDGRYLAGGRNGKLVIGGAAKDVFDDWVCCLAVVNNNEVAVSTRKAPYDVLVVDTSTRCVVEVLAGHTDAVWGLAALPGILYSSSNDTTIRKWDMVLGTSCVLRSHTSGVVSVATAEWLPDALVSTSRDQTAIIWRSDEVQHVLQGHTASVYCVSITSYLGESYVITGSGDHTIRVWDFFEGTQLSCFHDDSSVIAVVTFNGKVLTGNSGGWLKCWV